MSKNAQRISPIEKRTAHFAHIEKTHCIYRMSTNAWHISPKNVTGTQRKSMKHIKLELPNRNQKREGDPDRETERP